MDQPCAVTSSVSSTIVVIWVPFRVTFVMAQMLTLPALSVVKYTLCSKPTPIMSTEIKTNRKKIDLKISYHIQYELL